MKIHILLWNGPWMLLCAMLAAHAADRPLTIEDAIALATQSAPQMASRRAVIEGAQAVSVGAGHLPDPELVAGVDNLPVNGPNAYTFGNDFMTMRKVGVMQSFTNGAKRAAQREQAQAELTVAESEATQTQLEISQVVADAWVSSYAAQTALKHLQELKPDIDLQADSARLAVASGRSSAMDALTARAAVSDLDDRILEAQREVASSRAELSRWIGEAADRSLAPAPSFRALPTRTEDILTSLHQHAALRTYDAKIAAAERGIDVAKADKRPNWSAELDYAQRGSAFSNMVSLEFRTSLPLWPRYRQDPAIHEKQAAVAQLEADRAAELKMHSAEASQMIARWESARDRADLYERERLPLARQRSQLALAGFQAGRIDLKQTLASFTDEIEIRRQYADLLGSLGHAWAYLNFLDTPGDAP